MNVLMHSCCGPCAEYPSQLLRGEGKDVTLFFYNPNIQPEMEWERRLEAFKTMATKHDFPYLVEGESQEATWRAFPTDKKSDHCKICYRMRMFYTAKRAKEMGFDAFTTTLLVSPWQDHEAIFEAMALASKKYGVEALQRDYSDGYRQGQMMAKEDGIYRQKYCACIYSILESPRFVKKICRELNLEKGQLPQRKANL